LSSSNITGTQTDDSVFLKTKSFLRERRFFMLLSKAIAGEGEKDEG
jgi:hypothetical protein